MSQQPPEIIETDFGNVDRLSCTEAIELLSIPKTSFHRLRNELDIPVDKDGRSSFISIENFQRMADHLSNDNKSSITVSSGDSVTVPRRDLEILAGRIKPRIREQVTHELSEPRGIMFVQEQLSIANEKGWKLTTKQLSQVLGLSTKSIVRRPGLKEDGYIKSHGFMLTSLGSGIDRLWEISLID